MRPPRAVLRFVRPLPPAPPLAPAPVPMNRFRNRPKSSPIQATYKSISGRTTVWRSRNWANARSLGTRRNKRRASTAAVIPIRRGPRKSPCAMLHVRSGIKIVALWVVALLQPSQPPRIPSPSSSPLHIPPIPKRRFRSNFRLSLPPICPQSQRKHLFLSVTSGSARCFSGAAGWAGERTILARGNRSGWDRVGGGGQRSADRSPFAERKNTAFECRCRR